MIYKTILGTRTTCRSVKSRKNCSNSAKLKLYPNRQNSINVSTTRGLGYFRLFRKTDLHIYTWVGRIFIQKSLNCLNVYTSCLHKWFSFEFDTIHHPRTLTQVIYKLVTSIVLHLNIRDKLQVFDSLVLSWLVFPTLIASRGFCTHKVPTPSGTPWPKKIIQVNYTCV